MDEPLVSNLDVELSKKFLSSCCLHKKLCLKVPGGGQRPVHCGVPIVCRVVRSRTSNGPNLGRFRVVERQDPLYRIGCGLEPNRSRKVECPDRTNSVKIPPRMRIWPSFCERRAPEISPVHKKLHSKFHRKFHLSKFGPRSFLPYLTIPGLSRTNPTQDRPSGYRTDLVKKDPSSQYPK